MSVVTHKASGWTIGTGKPLAVMAGLNVLEDEALALEVGAQIHGAVTSVFVNADGFKKSISAPGPGNYVTLAKAVAAASKRRHS